MPAAPPAVGEKNNEDADLPGGVPPGACANGLVLLELPMGAAFKWSRDMVEFAFTTLYMPRFLPGTADMLFISAMFCAMAARLTERCSDHATIPRHASTAAAKKARSAPTHIKTVPSGRVDFCIKAAPAVLGTCWFGTPTPARVGRPGNTTPPGIVTEGKALFVVVLAAAELCGAGVDCAALDDGATDDDAAAPSGAPTVERFGNPLLLLLLLFCARTAGATARRRPARPREERMAAVVKESGVERSR
jgi:hypothetical protein